MKDRLIARIVASYDDPVVRLYSRIRFVILRERFLGEIGQYLPSSGHVVDVGCGFVSLLSISWHPAPASMFMVSI